MQYRDIYSLPVRYRKWFVDRLIKHFEDRNAEIEKAKSSQTIPMGEIGPRKFS